MRSQYVSFRMRHCENARVTIGPTNLWVPCTAKGTSYLGDGMNEPIQWRHIAPYNSCGFGRKLALGCCQQRCENVNLEKTGKQICKMHCFLCTLRALHSRATGTPSEKQRLSTNGAIKETWSRSIVAAIGGVPWFCSANSWPEIIPCQGLVFPLTAEVYQVATWRKPECHSLVCCHKMGPPR